MVAGVSLGLKRYGMINVNKKIYLVLLLFCVVEVAMADDSAYSHFNKQEKLQQLTTEQYEVTQKEATEKPFANAYWDNKQPGIYVDVVSGEPLFSTTDQYDSGCGWPSFTKPIDSQYITSKIDRRFFMERTEVRSKYANSHLGHVFDDGPGPTHQRFCINSAAMRFIPVDKLEQEGYGKYKFLFEMKK